MLKPFDMSETNEYDAYLAYLNSKTWADKRNLALERDSYKCSICGNPNNLQVHHLCYPRTLGTEPLSDLMTLCEHCHKDLETYKKGHRYDKRDRRWEECLTLWIQYMNEEDYDPKELMEQVQSEDLATPIIPISIYSRNTKKVKRAGIYCSFPCINILKKHFGEDNVSLRAGG